MRRVAAAALLVGLAALIVGCGAGEVSAADQKKKNDSLNKVAAESPNAGKVER